MPVNDKVKIFERSRTLFANGASGVSSSGQDTINRALDKNQVTKWRSVGSADTTTETIEITLDSTTAINRIFVLDHNWKSFTIKYDIAGVPTDFTSVTGITGTLAGGISETAFSLDTCFYSFDQVTTNKIYLTVTTTQTADEQKYASQVIATTELGTFLGHPKLDGMRISRNQKVKKTLSGKSLVQKSEESARFRLELKDYPSRTAFHSDLDLVTSLHDREENFLVWVCGGGRQEVEFNYSLRGYRLKDVYEMQVDRDLRLSYTKNVYQNPVNIKVSLVEAI